MILRHKALSTQTFVSYQKKNAATEDLLARPADLSVHDRSLRALQRWNSDMEADGSHVE